MYLVGSKTSSHHFEGLRMLTSIFGIF